MKGRITLQAGETLFQSVKHPERAAEGNKRRMTFVTATGGRTELFMGAPVYTKLVRGKVWRQYRKLIVGKLDASGQTLTDFRLIDNPELVPKTTGGDSEDFNMIKLQLLPTGTVELVSCPPGVTDDVLGQIVDALEKADRHKLEPGGALHGKKYVIEQVVRSRENFEISVDPAGVLT